MPKEKRSGVDQRSATRSDCSYDFMNFMPSSQEFFRFIKIFPRKHYYMPFILRDLWISDNGTSTGFLVQAIKPLEKLYVLYVLTESEIVCLIISLACLQYFRDLWWAVTWHLSAGNVCPPSECKGEWIPGRIVVRKRASGESRY